MIIAVVAMTSSCSIAQKGPGLIQVEFCIPRSNGICVKVVSAGTNAPIAGATVFIVARSGDESHNTVTDVDGVAHLDTVPSDTRFVVAQQLPFVINGLRFYPEQRTYYIEICGGAIP